MKRIGNSKELTMKALCNISLNLKNKLNTSVFLEVSSNSYAHTDEEKLEYRFSFVPGIDGVKCTGINVETWAEVLELYYKIMKEGLKNAEHRD